MGNTPGREVDLVEAYVEYQDYALNDTVAFCRDVLGNLEPNLTTLDDSVNATQLYGRCVDSFERPYLLAWPVQAAWSLAFAAMIAVAVAGNAMVVWIIAAHRHMRTVTNLFLLNLAVADFLLAGGNAAFNFVFMLGSHWPFGAPFCVLSSFVASLTVSTSVFTILAVSLDRFVAVSRPLRPRMGRRLAASVLALVWGLGCALSAPSLLYATTTTYRYSEEARRTLCHVAWPDGDSGDSHLENLYNIVFLVTTYVVPMSCMTVTYTWVGFILWRSKAIGESTDAQKQAIKSKQKVVHMLVAVMLIFGICWLPYHLYFLYTYYNPEVVRTDYVQHVYLGIYWLAMSNSCYNPIVYYVMNARFRGYFRRVLCFRSTNRSTKATANGLGSKAFPSNAGMSLLASHRTRSSRMSGPRSNTKSLEELKEKNTPL